MARFKRFKKKWLDSRMPFLILDTPTPLDIKYIWTKETKKGAYDHVDDKKLVIDKQEWLVYRIWGGQ